MKRLASFTFYGNYFYGICAVALSIESNLQQEVGLNSLLYYTVLYSATVVYYTKAYLGEVLPGAINKRSQWYLQYKKLIKISQHTFSLLTLITTVLLFFKYAKNVNTLSLFQWIEIVLFPVIAFLYYGIFPISKNKLNLRQTGWLKPFFIGFVWAGAVTVYPLLFKQIETGAAHQISLYGGFLFIKNWMFISVLSIMFDIKDYAADHNQKLKTFVVQIGLRKTFISS